MAHRFADSLGEAFQLSDDIHDLSEDAATTTANACRPTEAYEHGAQRANRRVSSLVNKVREVVTAEFGATRPALLLRAPADYVAARDGSRTGAVAKTFN